MPRVTRPVSSRINSFSLCEAARRLQLGVSCLGIGGFTCLLPALACSLGIVDAPSGAALHHCLLLNFWDVCISPYDLQVPEY